MLVRCAVQESDPRRHWPIFWHPWFNVSACLCWVEKVSLLFLAIKFAALPELKGSFWIATTDAEISRPVDDFSGHWFNRSSHSSRMSWRSTWRYWGTKNYKRERREELGGRERERDRQRISERIPIGFIGSFKADCAGNELSGILASCQMQYQFLSVTCYMLKVSRHNPLPRSS